MRTNLSIKETKVSKVIKIASPIPNYHPKIGKKMGTTKAGIKNSFIKIGGIEIY